MAPAGWWRGAALAAAVAALAACGDRPSGSAPPPLVFAAASLSDLAGDWARAYAAPERPAIRYNFAGSQILAQQILAAPGADLFLSADASWMDRVEEAGRLVAGSRRALLTNQLVVVARRDSVAGGMARPAELAAGEYRMLAMGDPGAVPVGRYGRQALSAIELSGGSVWQAVAPRVAPLPDARAVLAMVESDPRIVGIVYRTDALASRRAVVLFDLPLAAGAPSYHAALVAGGDSPAEARRFLAFLSGQQARELAVRRGFGAPAA